MELEQVRIDTIELIEKIQPKLQEGVFSPDQFRVHFETPYRARTLQKLQAYEAAHNKLFCRNCIKKHPTKNFLFCYQLWIEESDNLLENKDGEWLSVQCMNEECDFDLITPKPQRSTMDAGQMERMMEELRKYELQQQRARQSTPYDNIRWGSHTGDATAYAQQAQSASLRQQYNELAQRYGYGNSNILGGLGGALSSAGTLGAQAAPQKKK